MQAQICEYYVQRKKRQCKFKAIAGSRFCSSHCSDLAGKIPCPFEKGVYIDADKYQVHIQICPKIRQRNKIVQSTWFEKGVNNKQYDKINNEQKIEVEDISNLSAIDPQKLQGMIFRIIKIYLDRFSQQKSIQFVKSTVQDNVCQLTDTDISQLTNDHKQAFLLAQIGYKNGLIRNDVIYVEFGAGKGILSYAIAKKVKQITKENSKNVLLERQARRNKFDKFFRDNPYFQRYKSDVSDFNLKMLPQTMQKTIQEKIEKGKFQKIETNEIIKNLQGCSMVGICKHMCGAALDISIRGLLQGKDGGCIMASCCHHLCSYQSYLNPKFFEDYKLSADQIQLLFRISSWGTKSALVTQQQINFEQLAKKKVYELSKNDKTIIGRICKRLIDLGRAEFLNGKLIRYCSDQITPENYVIVYTKLKKNQ